MPPQPRRGEPHQAHDTPAPDVPSVDLGGAAVAAVPQPVVRASVATDVALVATGAAFIAVCGPGALALQAVPVTLQTLGVLLVGAVLRPRLAVLAVLLYLAVGFAGMPVFAGGKAGLAALAGASGGFLVSFPVAAAATGWLVRRVWRGTRPVLRAPLTFAAAMLVTLLVVYPVGLPVMGARLGMSLPETLLAGVGFLPGDVLKAALVAVVAPAVLRAFPQLLGHRAA